MTGVLLSACGNGNRNGVDVDEAGGLGLDPQALDPQLVDRGEQLFSYRGCVTCHTVDGTEGIGPSMRGLFGSDQELVGGETVVVDAPYIRRSLLEPDEEIAKGYREGQMPDYRALLSDTDVDALIAYIASLKGDPEAGAPGAGSGTGGTAGGEDLQLREDGRPQWWFDGVREPDIAAYTVCGEALGTSISEAHEGAVADARRTLRDQLGAGFDAGAYKERVLFSLALPLPNPGGTAKHAAYVKLALVEKGGDAGAPAGGGPD